jgi:hypothetical protein
MKTTELFEKHFGDTPVVNTDHPNIENFFEELNQICLEEGRIKKSVTIQVVS